jgi:protease-4
VLSTNRKLTPEELAATQAEVDQIYDMFLTRVSKGRKMTKEEVNFVARGRVWTGRDALRIGLVDQLGGLTDAISYAANLAKIKDAKVLYYPLKKEDKLSEIFEMIESETGDDEEADTKIKANSMPSELVEYYNQLKKIEAMSGIQMRMPFEVKID